MIGTKGLRRLGAVLHAQGARSGELRRAAERHAPLYWERACDGRGVQAALVELCRGFGERADRERERVGVPACVLRDALVFGAIGFALLVVAAVALG